MTAEKLDLDELEQMAKSSHTFGIAPGIALNLIARVKEAEAERDAFDAFKNRFWEILDADGLADVPSDEIGALCRLKRLIEIERQRAETAEAELAALRERASSAGQYAEQITDLTGRLASVEGERDRLREALEPFGRAGEHMAADDGWADSDELHLTHAEGSMLLENMTAGDFRRASAALAPDLSTPAPAGGGGDADLDARMKAAGMIPLSELLAGGQPLDRWMAHAGVKDHATFEQWLVMRYGEFLRMRAGYELGDRTKDDLYEWVLAHAGAFSEVLVNWRAANAPLSPTEKED